MRIITTFILIALTLILSDYVSAQQNARGEQKPNLTGDWELDKERCKNNQLFEAMVQMRVKKYEGAELTGRDTTTLKIVHDGPQFSFSGRTVIDIFDSKGKLTQRYSLLDDTDKVSIGGPIERKTLSDGMKIEKQASWKENRLQIVTKTSFFAKEIVNGSGLLKSQYTVHTREDVYSLSLDGQMLTIEISERTEYPPGRWIPKKVTLVYRKTG